METVHFMVLFDSLDGVERVKATSGRKANCQVQNKKLSQWIIEGLLGDDDYILLRQYINS